MEGNRTLQETIRTWSALPFAPSHPFPNCSGFHPCLPFSLFVWYPLTMIKPRRKASNCQSFHFMMFHCGTLQAGGHESPPQRGPPRGQVNFVRGRPHGPPGRGSAARAAPRLGAGGPLPFRGLGRHQANQKGTARFFPPPAQTYLGPAVPFYRFFFGGRVPLLK